MKLISIGYLDKNILYPIIGGVINCIYKFILSDKESTKLTEHSLILSVDSSLGMSLSFFLLLFYKKRKKPKTGELTEKKMKSHEIKLEYIDQYEEIRYNKYKYILISSVIDFLVTILVYNYCINLELTMWILDILFMYLFSYFIFKMKLYRHHKISILIIFVTGFILNLIHDRYIKILTDINLIFSAIIKLFCEIFISFGLVINKYTMEKKFCSSFELCFYQGVITFILFTFFLIIATCFDIVDNFFVYYNDFKNSIKKETLMFILVMLLQFLKNLFIFATIENTTAFHYLIIIVIGELSSSIKNIIDESEDNSLIENIVIIICLFIIFFMILVFIEIIELKCFGLQKNTKKEISNRAEIDKNINALERDTLYSEMN